MSGEPSLAGGGERTMTERELLNRWSNLEPGRVAVTSGSTLAVRVKGHLFGVSTPGVVLAAVIEAVEVSGRIFALDGGLDMPDRYVANVTRKGCGWLDGTNAGAETPAAALLAAYLAALEAEADQ